MAERKSGGGDERAARLKAALRANLQRRKAQARARDQDGDAAEPAPDERDGADD